MVLKVEGFCYVLFGILEYCYITSDGFEVLCSSKGCNNEMEFLSSIFVVSRIVFSVEEI